MSAIQPEEFLIHAVSTLLPYQGRAAVGAASPIPGAAALLKRHQTDGAFQVALIHGAANNPFMDGGRELFDLAGQGRIDVFFLGGVQIDGQANLNLVGTGPYPETDRRFPGSFGSAYMYFTVPRVILFRPEHSRRVFVEKVDFNSAPGVSASGVHRPGGPYALVTELCIMHFDAARQRFRLSSVHPGVTLEQVRDQTGFDFDLAPDLCETPNPTAEVLQVIRGDVAKNLSGTYPDFAKRVFQISK